MKIMNLFYHPKHTVYSSSSEMEAMKLYIETGQGYTPDYNPTSVKKRLLELIGRL